MAIFVAWFSRRGTVVVDHDVFSRGNNNSRDCSKADEATY
jgi:hypothetical protein